MVDDKTTSRREELGARRVRYLDDGRLIGARRRLGR